MAKSNKIKKNQDNGSVLEEKAPGQTPKRGKGRPKKVAPSDDMLEMQQLDGKSYNKHNVQSIDELLGETNHRYDTHDIKAYEEKLNRMNTSDLQRHAISVQILPKENRALLIKLLLKQFQVNNSGYIKTPPTLGAEKPISQEVMDILGEGR